MLFLHYPLAETTVNIFSAGGVVHTRIVVIVPYRRQVRQRVTDLRCRRRAQLAAPWEELTDEAPTVTGVFEDFSINSSLFTGLSTLRCSSRNTSGGKMKLGSRANSIVFAARRGGCADID